MEPEDPVGIRPAHAADLEQIFALATEFATSFRLEIDVFSNSFRRLTEQPDVLFLVAVQSGHVIGFLLGLDHDTLFANGRVAWIEELMVSKSHRRKGIATR